MNNFYSFLSDFFPLIIFSLWGLFLFIFYVVKKETNQRFIKTSLLIFLLVTLSVIVAQSFSLFSNYYNSSFLKNLIFQTDFYWVKVTRLVVSQVISVFFALFFSLIFFFLARKTHEELIDALDVFFLSFSLLVIGWPNFLLFLILLFLMAVMAGLIQAAVKRNGFNQRFILTPYIIPAFILILWLGNFLARLTLLDKIRF